MDSEKKISDVFTSYRQLFFYILSKWKQLLLLGIIGGCLSLPYIFIKKDTYVAQLNFVSEGGSSGGFGGFGGGSFGGGGSSGSW